MMLGLNRKNRNFFSPYFPIYVFVILLILNAEFQFYRCYARLHPRAVNCRKKKCGHSNQVDHLGPLLLI